MNTLKTFVIISMFLISSCKEDVPLSDLENGKIHGVVLDKTTDLPIPDATVYLKSYELDGSIVTPGRTFTVASTMSDSNGNFSMDFEYDKNYGYFCLGYADQYFDYQEEFVIDDDISVGDVNVEVTLQPIAYLSIHCVNENPFDASDKITLSLPLNGEYPEFYGENVDTVVCCFAVNGNTSNQVTWYVDKNNISTNTSAEIYCPAFDTTYFEILY